MVVVKKSNIYPTRPLKNTQNTRLYRPCGHNIYFMSAYSYRYTNVLESILSQLITYMHRFKKVIRHILKESNSDDAFERFQEEFKEDHEEWGTSLYEFIDGLPDSELEELVPEIYSDYFGNPKEYRDVVYHQTTPENYEKIKTEGLSPSNKTRGISNRGTGSVIFTSAEIDEMNTYGDVTLQLDLSKVGDIETTLEEPVEEVIRKNALMSRMGGEPEQFQTDSSDGLQDSTLVVYGHIPPNAIELVES